MGTIKFFNGGQAVNEAMFLSSCTNGYVNTNNTFSIYPLYTYSEKELTTQYSNYIVPGGDSTSTRYYGYCVSRFAHTPSYYLMCASSDGTHDKTAHTFTNIVADVEVTTDGIRNGQKFMALTLTNNSADEVTVRSIQRSSQFYFHTASSSTSQQKYYLDWAYYLDESEYIALAAGETKSITLNISMADLTA